MKATRKLIPAFAMLLIAAVMMSTATFAWFSTNSDVYADGMSVTAKTSQTFLVIATESTLTSTNYTTTRVSAVNSTADLLPIAFVKVEDNTLKWQTATGTNGTNGSPNAAGYTPSAGGTDYYLKNTFYVRVADNAPSASKLILKEVTIGDTDFNKAVSVVVHVPGTSIVNTYRYNNNNTDIVLTNTTALAETVTNNEEVTLDVYVYIDGDNPLVTNANATALADLTVELHFSVGE